MSSSHGQTGDDGRANGAERRKLHDPHFLLKETINIDMKWMMVMAGFFISLVVKSQPIPPSAVISYQMDDGKLIPVYKEEFRYGPDNLLVKTTSFENTSRTIRPRWQILVERVTEYNAQRQAVYTKSTYYYNQDANGQAVKQSSYESFNSFNEDGLYVSDIGVSREFDENGQQVDFNAFRQTFTIDNNGCYTNIVFEESADEDLSESSWNIIRYSITTVNDQCQQLSQENYFMDKLESRFFAERDGDLLLYQEYEFNLLNPEVKETFRTTYEYNLFRKLIYVEHEGFIANSSFYFKN